MFQNMDLLDRISVPQQKLASALRSYARSFFSSLGLGYGYGGEDRGSVGVPVKREGRQKDEDREKMPCQLQVHGEMH